jgi:hypothetical protein
MAAKAKVLARYPMAQAKRYPETRELGRLQATYQPDSWTITVEPASGNAIAEGKTEDEAWEAAAMKLHRDTASEE